VSYYKGLGVPQNNVVAYALWDVAAAQASSGNACASQASKVRSVLAANLTAQDIKAAQALSREMSQPGNLLKALDRYLATSVSKDH